jgi:hypothetical protein
MIASHNLVRKTKVVTSLSPPPPEKKEELFSHGTPCFRSSMDILNKADNHSVLVTFVHRDVIVTMNAGS